MGEGMRAVQIDAHRGKQRGVDLKMQVHSTALKYSQSIDVHGIDGLTSFQDTAHQTRSSARQLVQPAFALAVCRSKNSRVSYPLCCEGWSRRSMVWPFPPREKGKLRQQHDRLTALLMEDGTGMQHLELREFHGAIVHEELPDGTCEKNFWSAQRARAPASASG